MLDAQETTARPKNEGYDCTEIETPLIEQLIAHPPPTCFPNVKHQD